VQTGAGSVLYVPGGGDAKYIGVNSGGLAEQRQALENDRRRAAQMAGQLDRRGADAESGEALRLRISAMTTMLTSIAMTSGEALEQILRHAAIWVNANPDDVQVEPSIDFVEDQPPDLESLVKAKNMGLPISWRSIHNLCRERDLTGETFDDELDQIAEEKTTLGADGAADNDLDPQQEDEDDDERDEPYPQ
jgi:hypothetical protein